MACGSSSMSRVRAWCPTARACAEKPTLLLLHGGPGFDHSIYKPVYSSLVDCVQVVYLDHRGNGRSDAGPTGCVDTCTMGRRRARLLPPAWHRASDRVGNSFGGKVALAYATRTPISTEAAGGTHKRPACRLVREIGRTRGRCHGASSIVRGGIATWPSCAALAANSLPLYTRTSLIPSHARVLNNPVSRRSRLGGSDHTFNMLSDLAGVRARRW